MLLVIFKFIITLVHDMCMEMLSCQSVFADFLQKDVSYLYPSFQHKILANSSIFM